MKVRICWKYWELVVTDVPGEDWGECDPPDLKHKQIRIDKRVVNDSMKLMDTVLHEMLHAAVWSLDETYVEDYATVAARVLHKLGYRLVEPPSLPYEPYKEGTDACESE